MFANEIHASYNWIAKVYKVIKKRRHQMGANMKLKKLTTLFVIITLNISAVLSGCNKSNTVNNTLETQTIQTATESTQPTPIEVPTEKYIEESTTQVAQEVTVNANSTIATNNNPEVASVKTEPKVDNTDFVANLKVSNTVNQMIVVAATGSTATITMHEIENGVWTQIMSTSGYVGKQGVGSASESSSITPAGIYTLSIAFGVKDKPEGTLLPYTKVNDSYYWVDDPYSPYYNKFLSTNNVVADWNSAEQISKYPIPYAYVIAIDYNLACTPNAGSAIFFHCSNGSPTLGCVSIPEDNMIFVLQHIHSGCVIVIDTVSGINKY